MRDQKARTERLSEREQQQNGIRPSRDRHSADQQIHIVDWRLVPRIQAASHQAIRPISCRVQPKPQCQTVNIV